MAVKILVVDADPTVQRALGQALMQAGYESISSSDPGEAIRIVGTDRPALVLIAATLPGTDGFTLLARARAAAAPTHLPVILLLAEGQVDQRAKALRAGADDYLMKPFHPAELLARIRSLLARYSPVGTTTATTRRQTARVVVFYGAKGGVGTTTIAINAAIGLRKELDKKVCLVDANLQFGDHRVFMDLGLDRKSIVDLAQSPAFDLDLIRQILVRHESGVELLLAPPSPEMAELVGHDVIPSVLEQMSTEFDYVVVDIDKRLDEVNLQIMDRADMIYVVLTADLPCLKNVRLVLETIGHLGYEEEKIKLVLNRSNAFTGINVKNAESALKRKIDFQVVNEYRAAIGALNSGTPFMDLKADSILSKNLLDFIRTLDRETGERQAARAAHAAV